MCQIQIDVFSRFDRTPACDGQTDRQTQGIVNTALAECRTGNKRVKFDNTRFDFAELLLLSRLMGRYCFTRWRLSSSVMLPAGGPAGRRARGRSGGRHCTAGQYGYVPLGRHLVLN